MSSVSLPVTRSRGRALVVGSTACRGPVVETLKGIGFECEGVEDPYAATAEICRRPADYQSLVISLQSIYREELVLIRALKGRFPRVEIWLTDLDGRAAALADALSFGADGLLTDDGLHRLGAPPAPQPAAAAQPAGSSRPAPESHASSQNGDRGARPSERPTDGRSTPHAASDRAGGQGPRADEPARPRSGNRPLLPPGPPPETEGLATAAAVAATAAPSAPLNGRGRDAHAGYFDHDEHDEDGFISEPVLTADELRALLHEHPSPPYAQDG